MDPLSINLLDSPLVGLIKSDELDYAGYVALLTWRINLAHIIFVLFFRRSEYGTRVHDVHVPAPMDVL